MYYFFCTFHNFSIFVSMVIENFITNNEYETLNAGKNFAKSLKSGDIVALFGELGSGKTEFVKGICDFFDVDELVTSPTFTIMNQYNGMDKLNNEIPIYHIDLYRINKKEDLKEIGFEDCMFTNNAIKLVEWAEKAENLIPRTSYSVEIKPNLDFENLRNIIISDNK